MAQVPIERYKHFFKQLNDEGFSSQEIFNSLMAISLHVVTDLANSNVLDTDSDNRARATISFSSPEGEPPLSIVFNLGKEYYPSQEDQ